MTSSSVNSTKIQTDASKNNHKSMEIAGSSFATAESAFGPGGLRQLGRRSGTTEQHVNGRSVTEEPV